MPKSIIEFESKSAVEILEFFLRKYGNRIALASSMSLEDQAVADMMIKINPHARIFIIDTGRLHQETYDVIARSMDKYKIKFEFYVPDSAEVEKMAGLYGPNLFYDSVKNRKLCCEIRKVRPLGRALRTCDAWITGLRREQTLSRQSISKIENDKTSKILKINPIADWTSTMVRDYIKKNKIPYNVLYDDNYTSIGCAPCTRPVKPGEDIRAGRWWWEKKSARECGMH